MPSDPKTTHTTHGVTNTYTHALNKCIPTEVAALKAYLQFHFLLREASAPLELRSVWVRLFSFAWVDREDDREG